MAGLNAMGRPAPNLKALGKYKTALAKAVEVIWQPLYDYQTYAQAGQQSLSFFQVPVGQSSKTYADTNMEMPGQLPAGMNFLCTGVEVLFWPGGAIQHTAASSIADDQRLVMQSGFIELFMLQKVQLREAPLQVFPPLTGLTGFAATNITSGTDGSVIEYARNTGPTYQITPIQIPSSQNFVVKMTWPTAVAVSVAGRIGVRLLGWTYRNAQ